MTISTNKLGVLIVEIDTGGALRSAGDRVIVGSSRTQMEQQWVVRQKITESILQLTECIHRHDGIVCRKAAESIFATFPDARRTFAAAADIMKRHAAELDRALDTTNTAPLNVRMGLSFGKLNVDAGQVSGDPIYTAGQLAARAGASHILAAESFVNALGEEAAPFVKSLGSTRLEGLQSEIETFEVSWKPQGEEPETELPPPRDPEFAETYVLPGSPKARPTPANSTPRLKVATKGNEIVLGPSRPRVTLRSGKDRTPHARIERRGEQYFLVNLAANGTRVRSAGQEEVCHGEQPLQGEGLISVGADFDEESPEVVRFCGV